MAVSLIVYDATLVIPTQVVQRLVDAITKQSLTEACGLFFGDWLSDFGHPGQLRIGLYLASQAFQQSIHFKFDMQRRAFHKLVAMRTPFYEKFRSGDMMNGQFSTDVEMLQDMVGYGLMIILYAGGMIAFVIPVMFLISWEISLWGWFRLSLWPSGPTRCLNPWNQGGWG